MMADRSAPSESGIELSVIVPCFNEELNVPELTHRVLGTFDAGKIRGELVLVDDGSRDGTRRVIEEQMLLHPSRVNGQFHRRNAGMAAAWRTGVNAARGAHVATIDADLQYQPEDLLRLYRTLIESSVDIVQGYRSSVGRLRDGRFVLSRGLNIMLNASFGMNLRDNKSGFVCCAREVLQDLLRYKGRYSYWQSFIMVAAHAKGYSYREIETLFEDRKQGQSFLDGQAYRASARNFVDVGRALWEYRLNAEARDPALKILEPRTSVLPPRAHAGIEGRVHFRARSLPLHAAARTVRLSFETLDGTQWLSAAQIRELQSEKLKRLIRHAHRAVPYYRARMQELGLHPVDIRGLEDLHRLPLLNRDDVRQHLYFDMVQEGVSPAELTDVRSSGRAGEPVVGYAGKSDMAFRLAAALRAYEWAGCRVGEATLRLDYDEPPTNTSDALRQSLESLGARRTTIQVGRLDPSTLRTLATRVSRHHPALIEADGEMLTALSEHIANSSGFAQPRAVLSTGQRLSAEHRALVEGAFGCRVYDLYASGEFGGIACETGTPDEHMVFAESCIVEILVDGRPARPGELGEVVVTDLNNQVMPLIRYRIGDMAEAIDDTRPSQCGRGLPRIGRILGRSHAFVHGLDGSFVPSGFFDHLFKDYFFAVRKFRVMQEVPGTIRLEIVKAPRYSDETLDRISSLIRAALGRDLAIDVVFSDGEDIPRSSATAARHPLDAQRAPRSVQPRHGN